MDGRISFLISSPSSAEFPLWVPKRRQVYTQFFRSQHCEIDLDVECPELSRFVMNIAIALIDPVLSTNAFHENAVYVKSESAILMLFSMLSFLKPTFLS
jgi:hypothetical protein